jgi:hypothetical protein
MDFAEGLLAITKRLENKGKKPLKVDFVSYNPATKTWKIRVSEDTKGAKKA